MNQQSNFGLYHLEARFNIDQYNDVMQCLTSEVPLREGDRVQISPLQPEDFSDSMLEEVRLLEAKLVVNFRSESFNGTPCPTLTGAKKFVKFNRFYSFLGKMNVESLSLGVGGAFMTIIERGVPTV